MLGAAALIGVATYMFANFGTLGDNIKCTVNGLVDLSTLGGTASAQASVIPEAITDALESHIDSVSIAAILPAAFAAALVLLASLCGLRNAGSFKCAKCMIVIAEIFLILSFIFYFVIFFLSLISDTDQVTEQTDEFTSTCTETLPDLQDELVNAQATLISAQAMGADTSMEQADVDHATDALEMFDTMCGCLLSIIPDVQELQTPALLCAVVSLLEFIFINCLCCSAGCCRNPLAGKTAPQGYGSA